MIEVSVVALESGGIGQSIRVATPDYKQQFHAEVVSASQLEGSM
jgi:flagella basal body P-ring formation protein FlgA